eukprot:s2207_g9.t1
MFRCTAMLCSFLETDFDPDAVEAPVLPPLPRISSRDRASIASIGGRASILVAAAGPPKPQTVSTWETRSEDWFQSPFSPMEGDVWTLCGQDIADELSFSLLMFSTFLTQDHPIAAGAIEPVLTFEQPRASDPVADASPEVFAQHFVEIRAMALNQEFWLQQKRREAERLGLAPPAPAAVQPRPVMPRPGLPVAGGMGCGMGSCGGGGVPMGPMGMPVAGVPQGENLG